VGLTYKGVTGVELIASEIDWLLRLEEKIKEDENA
jgi:hypothetical protein